MKSTISCFSIFLFLLLVIANCAIPSKSDCKPEIDSAQNTLLFLKRVSCHHPLLGHQDALLYGQDWWLNENETCFVRSDIYSVCGAYPVVMGLDISLIEINSEKNYDGCLFRQMIQAAIMHHERGGIITVSWHMSNPITNGSTWDLSAGNVIKQVLEDTLIQAKFYKWLDRGADFMNQLRDKEGHLIPILFRPLHECNMNGFWWSGNSCSNEEYIALWRLIHDYMVKEKGLNQLIWVFSPYDVDSKVALLEKYPGDQYVDVIGYERYQLGAKTYKEGVERFVSGVRKGLDITIAFAKERKKVAAFTETGFPGIPYENWWTEALGGAIKGKQIAYVMLWRNHKSKKHFFGPCPNSVANSDFKTFIRKNRIEMLKN